MFLVIIYTLWIYDAKSIGQLGLVYANSHIRRYTYIYLLDCSRRS
jgi:hypothetical protein